MADEALFKEDAERLAARIVDENPMVDILEISMDPELGGYTITAYDYGADEEFTVEKVEGWNARRSQSHEVRLARGLAATVREKHGRKVGSITGHWVEVRPDDWPESVCGAVSERRYPGEAIVELEPSLAEAQTVYPGGGPPDAYGFDGSYLVMVSGDDARVFKQIVKLANFTLEDQSGRVGDWRTLGFDIAPRPEAPFVEPGGDGWSEDGVVEEVRDRLLDLSEQGFGAILVDGATNVTAYAWVLAGALGLKVVTAWEQSGEGEGSGFTGMGFTELLNFKEVEGLL